MASRRSSRAGFMVVVVAACVVYWLTAYPTITWWDSSVYSLGAVTLGITHPPGSFLLTALGWLVTRLPLGLTPAYALNLFAGLLAAVAAALVYLAALHLLRLRPPHRGTAPTSGLIAAGAALGALTFAFGLTLWQHAVKFTPYVLTAVFTALILLGMLRWWRDADHESGWRWLLLLGLLFGLDVSVHRTNLLLLPGLLAWILIRRPRTLLSPTAWLAGGGGVLAGLAFHLLIIPRAVADPALNFGDPSTWGRFYDYVSLAPYGGGFLVQFLPRNAPFWAGQVMDLVRAFGADFFGVTGPLGVLGLLPGAFGLLGLALLWSRHRRLGTAFVLLMALHAAATVLYFNIPANFFRPLTRHYLPVFVPFGIVTAYGVGRMLELVAELNWGRERSAMALAALVLTLVPGAQLARHWTTADGSRQFFTEDYARNLLSALPDSTILFTSGDNDTWPLWYVQTAQRFRQDVQVVNLPLTNSVWFVEQLVRRDPAFPLSLSADDRRALSPSLWTDTTITVPVRGPADRLGLPADAVVPDSITLSAAPTAGGTAALRQDLVLLRILQDNHWRRPLAFGLGTGPQGHPWLAPYRRVDGLHARIVPLPDPPADTALLRANLLDTYVYRGYADERIRLDDVTQRMAQHYVIAFLALGAAERRLGQGDRCAATRDAMQRVLPPARLGMVRPPDPCDNQTAGR